MAYNKYYVYKRQVSTDNGQTWTDVYPLETKPYGSPIGTYGTLDECNGIFKFRADYSDSTTYSAPCDSTTVLTTATTRAHSTSYTAMTEAEVGDCVTVIDDRAFRDCHNLATVKMPDTITTIGNYAFYACYYLSKIGDVDGVLLLPSYLTFIGNSAFAEGRSITSVYIQSNIEYIDYRAFDNCDNLTSVTCLATTPPVLGDEAFRGTSNDLIIYVPAASVSAYQTAWSNYASRIQAIPT